jgi:hypothetical protein
MHRAQVEVGLKYLVGNVPMALCIERPFFSPNRTEGE